MTRTELRRVRVELIELGPADAPSPSDTPPPGPLGRAAALGAVIGLIAVLWALVRPEAGSDAADRPIVPTTTTVPAVEGETRHGDGLLEERTTSFPLPAPGLENIVEWDGSLLAAGVAVDDRGPVILASTDALHWERKGAIRGAGAILDLEPHDGALRALTATSTPDRATQLTVFRSSDGERWDPDPTFGTVDIAGFVQSGSLRGDRWVVVADRQAQSRATGAQAMGTIVHTGDADGEELGLQVAPDEFVKSYAATETGFIASIVRVDLASTSRSARNRLGRWSANWGLQDISRLVAPFGQAPDVLDRARLAVVSGPRILEADDPDGLEWTPVAWAPDGLPVVRSAIVGSGAIAYAPSLDGTLDIAVSVDGIDWMAGTITDATDARLLRLADDHAVLVVDADSGPRLVRFETSELPSLAVFRSRPVLDGEWSLPRLAPMKGGDGFIGVVNQNGVLQGFGTDNGLDWQAVDATDLPFGFFAERLRLTGDHYVALGRTGLLESRAFVSEDGRQWSVVPVVVPEGSALLEVTDVSFSASSRVVHGQRRGPDGDAEPFLQWTGVDGVPVDVGPVPCRTSRHRCSIVSAVATEDGLLALHRNARQVGTFAWRWDADGGWSNLDLSMDGIPVSLRRGGSELWLLGSTSAVMMDGDGTVLSPVIRPPEPVGSTGFSDVSPDGSILVFADEGHVQVGARRDIEDRVALEWTVFPLGGTQLIELLAIGGDAAVFRAARGASEGLLRLPAATPAR